jgi:iron complex transport system substrate-binding protein
MSARIVSLLPSATEIVCALGCGSQLVARSHQCDYPAEIESLPVCTETKLDGEASSAAIDHQVKCLLQNALSVYRVQADTLREIRPDMIITQTQCEVCAVTLSDVEAALREFFKPEPLIVSLAPAKLADLWDNILEVASALGILPRGRELTKALKNRVAEIIERSAQVKRRPSVACIEWIDPLMAAGNWVPELVELAGGLSLFGVPGKHSPWLNWDAVREHDPDFLIVMPCGFDLARTQDGMADLVKKPDWSKLRAVRNGNVFVTDGNHYFNRPGPRLVESLEILAEILHPERFRFGHRERGWARFRAATR